jgi:rRNA maturation endonuclease Nob1
MSKIRRKSDNCLNCDNALRPEDNFCPNCGQENNSHKVPVKHLLLEVFVDFFHFDTKLWNTVKASVTQPGKITIDYLNGKRARYVPPVKFYVFVSFIFFLLLGKLSEEAIDNNQNFIKVQSDPGFSISISELQGNKKVYHSKDTNDVRMISFNFESKDSLTAKIQRLKNGSTAELDKLLLDEDIDTTNDSREQLRKALSLIPESNLVLDSLKPDYGIYGKVKFSTKEEYEELKKNIHHYTDKQVDSLLLAKGEKANWFNRQMVKKLGKFDKNNSDDMKMITHAIIKSISLTMFIMMPLTAILLLLIFYRRKYYYEHLIFSIHIHTIFFVIFSLILTIQIFINEEFGNKLWFWAILLCLIYLIASLKNNYKQTMGKTIWKFILISIPYFIVSFILTVLAVIYGFLA